MPKMKLIRTVLRVIVGLVFIFSGFVKGVDPLGTVYRMDDYFLVFGMGWATPFALYLTIFLCTLEFILGISLLFNLWIRVTVWPLVLMMIYFTILTFFDAVLNLVPDCGCFGEAIKLTNVQTFLKNIVLMAMIIPIFIARKKFRGLFLGKAELLVLFLFAIVFAGMSVFSYRHLPLFDFMAWKVGNQVNKKSTSPVKFFLTFKNVKSGEVKEYISTNYPWNDSIWTSEWKFVSQHVIDPDAGQAMVLRIEDEGGNDITGNIIDNPDFQFILVAYDLTVTNKDAFTEILPFYKKAEADGLSFICLTSTNFPEIRKFRIDNGITFGFYTADDVVLKTMVRSNPGLILLRGGKVLGKWHYNDFPSYEEVKKLGSEEVRK
jgi:uncharacterized membrane protein YphA (DoxX/SURF4 family)